MGSPDLHQVALTFDDGPDPRDTGPVLDVLAHHEVPATFFTIGERAHRHPELVRAVDQAGHQQALHGYVHRPFPLESTPRLAEQLVRTQDALATVTGRPPETYRAVRPPYGMFTPLTLSALVNWGYRPVMWSVVPFHWRQPLQQSVNEALQQTRPGAILVLHESLAGPPVAVLTHEIVTQLKGEGYHFVTVDEMWGQRYG